MLPNYWAVLESLGSGRSTGRSLRRGGRKLRPTVDPKHTLLGAYVLYPSCRNLGRASRCLSQVAGGSIVGLPTRSASKKEEY